MSITCGLRAPGAGAPASGSSGWGCRIRASSRPAPRSANVNDAPGLNAGADDTAQEGTFYSHGVTLLDPDPDTIQVTVTDWGDGTPNTVFNTAQEQFNITHYFPDNGTYTVTVTANDQQGQGNSVEVDTFQVTVANVAPDLNLFGDATVEQNQLYTLQLGGVSDPGNDTVTEYRIDWGDGTPVQVIPAASLPANRQVTHTYATAGLKTIGISLVDEDGTFNNVDTKQVTLRNSFKPYPACRLTHAPFDAARKLHGALGARRVRSARVTVNPLTFRNANKTRPRVPLEGKFSTANCVALGLAGHRALPADFEAGRLADPVLQALAQRVEVVPVESMERWAARVETLCEDGTTLDSGIEHALGSLERPMGWPEIEAKFRLLVAPVYWHQPTITDGDLLLLLVPLCREAVLGLVLGLALWLLVAGMRAAGQAIGQFWLCTPPERG